MKGYSLLEVMVALFVLAGVIIAGFSIFESGGAQTLKVENAIISVRLAEEICEELHAKRVAGITVERGVPFNAPFDRYLYSVDIPIYRDPLGLGIANLVKVSVHVNGPLDASGNATPQTASASLCILMGRQPFER